jgi:MFS transporter, ACS family, tartrate transporter
MIAYVNRQNVAVAKLTMTRDLPGSDNAVIGFGAGIFFLGYFLLEIPGTLMVERWSARKWICRIMITCGAMAGLTAAVTTPWQFYTVRFFLGLAEAASFRAWWCISLTGFRAVIARVHWPPFSSRRRWRRL